MRPPVAESLLARPFESIRSGCAEVARRASHVHLDELGLQQQAEAIERDGVRSAPEPHLPRSRDPEQRCAFVLLLDAINFGSGYFPELRKRPGCSGYRTLEACLVELFDAHGAPARPELERMTAERCRELFGQDPASAAIAELMELFARAWRDLASCVRGDYADFIADCDGSAAELVRRLLQMPLYRDVADYGGLQVPLLKRAQLTVADLQRALGDPLGSFGDLDELTLFADNLVPHVLRLDGVLVFDPALVARIENEQLLSPGSREEVEIRALAVHAVERLAQLTGIPPRELDYWLWTRGAGSRYKARPRHRCRSVYY